MYRRFLSVLGVSLCALLGPQAAAALESEEVRFCVFNIEDLRVTQIEDLSDARMRTIARVIAAIRPDVLLINELEHSGGWGDTHGNPAAARSHELLAERLHSELIALGVTDLTFGAHAWGSNTGVPSGMDLNRDGQVNPELNTRAYGGDCFGYGEFAGQYAMALLVREGYEVVTEDVRTFATFRWKSMPGALLPRGDGRSVPAEEGWYTDEMLEVFRLSSKSHWDIPVRTPNGNTVHVLASHPTPPVFDGPEDRNGKRNHDEIRFWAEYVGFGTTESQEWIVDDAAQIGGIRDGASYIAMGDLNADPVLRAGEEGNLRPALWWLMDSGGFNTSVTPISAYANTDERADVTARWNRRVDYVLPSHDLRIARGAVFRGLLDAAPGGLIGSEPLDVPSDHYPVWIDVLLPIPAGSKNADSESASS